MRSPIGPVLIILNLAVALVLVLVLLQTTGLRGDLDATRADVTGLREQVDTMERGVPMSELSMRLAELENDIRDWVVAFGGAGGAGGAGDDPTSPAGGGSADADEILDRLDTVLDRLAALDDRVDEICGNVPVC
jgi:hypothetical protein